MTNMVTAALLNDDTEYFDIKEDVTSECSEYGQVRSVIIPRTKDGNSPSSEGLIFVEFQDPLMARTCAIALSGRKFDSRVVIVDYVSIVSELLFNNIMYLLNILQVFVFF